MLRFLALTSPAPYIDIVKFTKSPGLTLSCCSISFGNRTLPFSSAMTSHMIIPFFASRVDVCIVGAVISERTIGQFTGTFIEGEYCRAAEQPSRKYLVLGVSICAAQHPFGFEYDEHCRQYPLSGGLRVIDEAGSKAILNNIIFNDEADQYVGIQSNHR